MPTLLLLSPHLDDAAFSCGAAAARLAAAGWDVALVTLFTRSVPGPSGFALECQTSKGIAPEVDYMKLRRAEDAAAAVSLGCASVAWAGLPEAPHRGYGSAAELFRPPREDDDVEPIADACRAAIDRHRPDVLLAPQCWGRHADHVLMARALLSIERPPTAWWVDLPYAINGRERPPSEVSDRLPEGEESWPCGAGLAAKLTACAAYGSQLAFQFGGEAAMRAALDVPERFRLDAAARDALRPAAPPRPAR